ncbi:rapid ALkalinization Factor [Artemisia annua]|uniref:Rapid ALkalinization Factor n=1 Tax=Artemisia annua TaxID=35608 RepID=A0A2U1M6D5_ARTAN|nr:rapid ALkalinization Factor [Artemisia annua]
MFNGRTSSVCFTTTILSLLIILMATMIKDCDGSLASCNGSNAAECQQVFVEEEEEFMMDTEEHRRILDQTKNSTTTITYDALNPGSPACQPNCAGGKYIKPRGCFTYNRCK